MLGRIGTNKKHIILLFFNRISLLLMFKTHCNLIVIATCACQVLYVKKTAENISELIVKIHLRVKQILFQLEEVAVYKV